MPQPTQKLDQLTTTRFFAALSVVFFHGGRQLGIIRYLPMLAAGPTAVSYFFVLSGFVMALAYYRPDVPFNFRGYWLARFSRIYPVYILSLVLTCLHYPSILYKAKSAQVWSYMLLYQAWIPKYALSFNGAAWSLSVEVFFYLLLPILLIWFVRLSLKQVIGFSAGFWIVSQIVHSILTARLMPGAVDLLAYFPPFHLNSFLLGLAGGIWYLTSSSRQTVNQTKNQVWLAIALGAVLLLLSLRAYWPAFPQNPTLDVGMLAPLFLLIILTLARDTSRVSQTLSHPWLVLLGDASYALFILHIPIRWVFEKLLAFNRQSPTTSGIWFSIYVLTAIGISILIFQFIERPAREWLRTHPDVLTKMLLDIVLILAMTRLSFMLRLGTVSSGFFQTQASATRAGVGIFFLALLVFRFYSTNSWRSLALGVLAGTIVLSRFMYYAWTSGTVELFPRSILLLIPLLIFAAIYSSRVLMELWKPKVQTESGLG